FSSLEVDQLRHLIERVEVREVEPGETIVREGERGGSLFVIVYGEVAVLLNGPPKKLMARLQEGSFFGELAVLTDFPRSATVVAETQTRLLEISRELIAEIVANSPEVLRMMLRFFRDRLLDRLLGTSKLFASFTTDEARRLAQRFKFLELDPGTRVVREGERAPGLFLLLCGQVQVVRGRRQIAALGPGDVFGEMSLLTRAAAGASIETATKCWALALPREEFQEIVL